MSLRDALTRILKRLNGLPVSDVNHVTNTTPKPGDSEVVLAYKWEKLLSELP